MHLCFRVLGREFRCQAWQFQTFPVDGVHALHATPSIPKSGDPRAVKRSEAWEPAARARHNLWRLFFGKARALRLHVP